MRELVNADKGRGNIRRQLRATASALTLLGYGYGMTGARAAEGDSDRPTVWVELGGQLERVDATEKQFVPPFLLATPRPGPETISPLSVNHPPRYSVGGEAKITFEPNGTDWVFFAAVRYGRSKNSPHLRQQSIPTQPIFPLATSHATPRFLGAFQFIDTEAHHSESHTVLDFQAGKDVGVGLFGSGSLSQLNFGVRFAQFQSKSSIAFASDPDARANVKYFGSFPIFLGSTYHINSARETAARSFHGVGPAVSWSNSIPALGGPESGEITVDWGLNAAVLFGRQKAKVRHQATAQYGQGVRYHTFYALRTTLYQHNTTEPVRSRSVVVPNIGGFAGISARYSNAKLSLGYRADFFFGAMDGGIDVRKAYDRNFYGPFASISIGLGG